MTRRWMRLIILVLCGATVWGAQAVVAPEPLAADVGRQILARGGNAFDAAVAIGFALAVTYPQAGNIGGGGFALLYTPGSDPVGLDFRETAPGAARENMYLDKNGRVVPGLSTLSAKAAGVPGTIKGLWAIWHQYGRLPFAELLRPAIRLAREGFAVGPYEANAIADSQAKLKRDRDTARLLLPGGHPPAPGDKLVQPALAGTLEELARRGEAAFYRGRLGREFYRETRVKGGLITPADLAAYRVVWRTPVMARCGEDTIYSMPLPSSGGIALAQILGMLARFDTTAMAFQSPEYVHLLVEIEKRVYADRNTYLGDPEMFPIRWQRLLDGDYLRRRAAEIDPDKATPSSRVTAGYGPVTGSGLLLRESTETTSYAVLDAAGNCISLTYTLNGSFGSGIRLPRTGIMLNNEMDDFVIKPGVPNLYGLVGGKPNQIQPGKRMLSSITPTIVLRNGRFRMALGSPGGSTIITTVLQMYLNVTLFGQDARQAVSAPRFHHQWLPDKIRMEPEVYNRPGLRSALEQMGYTCEKVERIGDGVLILRDDNGRITAAADSRGSGVALVK